MHLRLFRGAGSQRIPVAFETIVKTAQAAEK
jgi:hypothetical protein